MVARETHFVRVVLINFIVVFLVGVTPNAVVYRPISGSTVARHLNVSFSLPVSALSGSVQVSITPVTGSTDTAGARIVSLSSYYEKSSIEQVLFFDRGLATAVADFGGSIVSVSPAVDLVPDTMYSVAVQYRDWTANPVSLSTASVFMFGKDRGLLFAYHSRLTYFILGQ